MKDSGQTHILAAGAVAAFTVDLLVYPLDTLKTRYQSGQQSTGWISLRAMRGLYQGVGSVNPATVSLTHSWPSKPTAAIFFATYESSKSLLTRSLPAVIPQPAIHSLASAGAELASCFVLTPAEVIKQNAQVLRQSDISRRGQSSSLLALQMLRHGEGGLAPRLWSGYTALAARNLPFTAMQFPMFEYLRNYLWRWPEHALDGPLIETGVITGCAAAVSGSIAAMITTPADVIKTRIMLGVGESSDAPRDGGNHKPRLVNKGGLNAARRVLQESGIRGLFRGAMFRATWAALGSGLYLGSYEVTKVWLKRRSS
ncbi:mitochondrial carrier [Canariomyces notabilis]|uniref:Mitochondrial carrier n=1 Tax=Canariomyces notabilis TaxID=2074819 RepID=A0AAN6TK59_9PEZI|nr:mitochondrial carrier [Canariomyces arenarius]